VRSEECSFCRVVAGTLDVHLIFADETSLAFLDHRPLFPGHCLLVPRAHHPTLTDLPEPLLAPLFRKPACWPGRWRPA
jgi:histidine triad (HIT) family protein